MSGKVNGFAVAYTALGGLLIYSGIKGTSLTATFTGLTHGTLDSTPEASAVEADTPAQDTAVIAAVSGSGPEAGVSLPSGVSEQTWVSDFLAALGAPATAANVSSVTDWIAHEGPYGTQGQNNPLNTTQPATGSTSFDGLAVQNYPSPTEGLDATVATLENGGYPQILMQLKAGTGLRSGAETDLLEWSGGGYSSV
jgi:hypothetical protein